VFKKKKVVKERKIREKSRDLCEKEREKDCSFSVRREFSFRKEKLRRNGNRVEGRVKHRQI
jgi:hypothetical protein